MSVPGPPAVRPLHLCVVRAGLTSRECRARIPFRFGGATLERAPMLTLRLDVAAEDGRIASGFSGDLCVPRWFEKEAGKSAEADIAGLIGSARAAARASVRLGEGTVFGLWRRLWNERVGSVAFEASDRLLRGFGVALVERAAIDAACRLAGVSFLEALRSELLGFRPGELAPELADWSAARSLAAEPLRSLAVRHTVGLGDRLRSTELGARLDDGFPECLEEDIERHGLSRFKLKLSGAAQRDRERLLDIAAVLEDRCSATPAVTLDANEQYRSLEVLAGVLRRLRADALGARLLERLAWIEQPLARERTFDVRGADPFLAEVASFAPLVIDEADVGLEAFPRAAELGYRGVSVKNCKGVFRALVNRARCERSGGALFQTGEDLTNLPVLPLQQDLATLAALGIGEAERNGHHYFRGLDHLPIEEARAALVVHPDLYQGRPGVIALRIVAGRISTGSLAGPGYGYGLVIRDELGELVERATVGPSTAGERR